MSTLTLVRHGQATPFEENPDRLSNLGHNQARMLGNYWLNKKMVFDEVYTGSLTRQQQTANLIGDIYREAGAPWPTPEVFNEFNEYDIDAIWEKHVPELLNQSPAFAQLFAAYQHDSNGPNHHRSFQFAMEAVMNSWQDGSVEIEDIETWPAFRDRVRCGVQHILDRNGSSRRVVVFTSGGPIGATIQMAMNAPDRSALEVNWRVRNCSLCEFVFTRGRLTLDSFNGLPHLDDRSLWSYR